MVSARKLRDPLLALEFLSLTFACGSRPLLGGSATSETGTPADASEGVPIPTTTTQPDAEDTDVDEWNTSSWNPSFLDGYGYDFYWGCDVFLQDCPDMEKCVPVADDDGIFGRGQCVPLIDNKPPGEPCTHENSESAIDDCDATGVCWFVEDGAGVCTPMCSGTADATKCPDELMCFHLYAHEALWVCVDFCNPLTQDCPAGQVCHWSYEGFGCAPSNDVSLFEPCESQLWCAAGSTCIAAESLGDGCSADSCCAAHCDTDDPDSCASYPGSTCTSWWGRKEPLTPELANVGVCLPL